jgi:hypothetical protein
MRARTSIFCGLLLTATSCGAGAPAPVSPVAASTTTHSMAASVQPPHIRAAVDAADRDAATTRRSMPSATQPHCSTSATAGK